MKKTLLSMLAFVALAVNAQEVTLDFTNAATDWNITYDSKNKCKGTESFNNGTYDVVFAGDGSNGFAAYEGYVLFGKQGAYVQLPAFDFTVEKIEFVGRSGASGSTKMNVFVGEDAVSTETTGCTETNTYEINPDYQAAGNVYTIKVTSSHNAQVTAIKVYKAENPDAQVLKADVEEIYLWNYTTTAWKDYQAIEKVINITAANLEENITYVMESSNKAQGSDVGEGMKFKIANNGLYENRSGQLKLTVTSKVAGTFEDAIIVKSGEKEIRIPVKLVVAGTVGDGYLDPTDMAPLSVADALLVHSIMPQNASYMTDETHKFDTYSGDYGQRCVEGIVTEIKEVSTQYGNATFTIKDSADDEEGLVIFRVKGIENTAITDAELLHVGDKVIVEGDLCDYNGTAELKTGTCGEETTGYIYSITAVSTAITEVGTAEQQTAIIYNLQGQRMSSMQKGINIIGGKKVMMK